MHWLVITAIAIFSRAFYSVSTKALTNNVQVASRTQSIIFPAVAACLTLFLIPFVGFTLEGVQTAWLSMIFLALSQGIGNVIFFKGQDYIDSGTTQVVLSSKIVWTALLSIAFLGSEFSPVQYLGMLVMIVGIVLIQHVGRHNKDIRKGMLYIGLSAIVFAVYAVAAADLSKQIHVVVYMLTAYGGASLFALLVGWRSLLKDKRYLQKHSLRVARYFLFAAGASATYFAILFSAYVAAPDTGVVAVLINAQVVSTVLVASILLKERTHMIRKLLAALLVVISAYMVSGV